MQSIKQRSLNKENIVKNIEICSFQGWDDLFPQFSLINIRLTDKKKLSRTSSIKFREYKLSGTTNSKYFVDEGLNEGKYETREQSF